MLVANRVRDGACSEVPDLRGVGSAMAREEEAKATHANRLVETPADEVQLVKLHARHRPRMPNERTMSLPSPHCTNTSVRSRSQPRSKQDALSHIRTHPSPVPLANAYPQNCTPPTKSSYISQLPSAYVVVVGLLGNPPLPPGMKLLLCRRRAPRDLRGEESEAYGSS